MTHKLKPRLFIKSYSALTSFLFIRAFFWIYLAKYYLFSEVVQYTHSRVYFYLSLHSSILCMFHIWYWPSKKLNQKRYGPFTIKEEIGQGVYRLELPEGWAIHNVFNEDLLTRCKKVEFASQHMDPAPPPDIINEKEEYEVEEIRGYHKKQRGTQFLVYWKGYGNKHN